MKVRGLAGTILHLGIDLLGVLRIFQNPALAMMLELAEEIEPPTRSLQNSYAPILRYCMRMKSTA